MTWAVGAPMLNPAGSIGCGLSGRNRTRVGAVGFGNQLVVA